jgi:hypothetical protein
MAVIIMTPLNARPAILVVSFSAASYSRAPMCAHRITTALFQISSGMLDLGTRFY